MFKLKSFLFLATVVVNVSFIASLGGCAAGGGVAPDWLPRLPNTAGDAAKGKNVPEVAGRAPSESTGKNQSSQRPDPDLRITTRNPREPNKTASPSMSIAPSIFAGQQWAGRARCGVNDVLTRLRIDSVGPAEVRPRILYTWTVVTATFEYGPVDKPLGVLTVKGDFMIEGKRFDLKPQAWVSGGPPKGMIGFFGLFGSISADNQVFRHANLSAISCDDFSMSADPERAAALIAAGQKRADTVQAGLNAAIAARKAKYLEETLTRTHYVSAKTGEIVDNCIFWNMKLDDQGKTRRFCKPTGEEIVTRYYVDPRMKRYSMDGRGEAYMDAMGLKLSELNSKQTEIGLNSPDFVWSEPFPVKDVNNSSRSVYIVLGCRRSQYYCAPTFQHADAIFLVDDVTATANIWMVNQETGMSRVCRVLMSRVECVRPKAMMGQSFNEIFTWPSGSANPFYFIKDFTSRNFDWANLTDKQRVEEGARITKTHLEFIEGMKLFAKTITAAGMPTANSDTSTGSEEYKAWARRQDNAFDWASQKRGRDPSRYTGD
jgi:hypothetical protein